MGNKITFIPSVFILSAIIILGFFLRIYDINWDQNFHLHPDERFLTMVGNAMKIPNNFSLYLNPKKSTMNPQNISFSFYVYGTFPVVMNKLLAVLLNHDNYNLFTLQGRLLSALFDTFTLIFVYLTASLLAKKYHWDKTFPYLAGFLYAIAVLPVQLSHFFTTDMFVNFFAFASFYFALIYKEKRYLLFVLLSSIFLGIGIASKITAVFLLPLVLFFLTAGVFVHHKNFFKKQYMLEFTKIILLFLIFLYFAARFADPYLFENSSLLSLIPNQNFLNSISTLNIYSKPDAWYPPGVQWIHKSLFFGLQNIALFGIGLPYFGIFLFGIYVWLKKRNPVLYAVIGWLFIFFIYQSAQPVKTMRYFILLYPFFSVITASGLILLNKRMHKLIIIIFIICICLWPLSLMSIYTRPHTRVSASDWIYKNVPDNSLILSEHWDDGLPLNVDNTYGKIFKADQIHSFDPDTPEKWKIINNQIRQANYLILSSNRGWGSIPTVPERYPLMTNFYKDLFAGNLSYKKIAEFTSYPSLNYLGIPVTLNDDFSEEAFTVYDHPKVLIFKNEIHK